MNRAPSMGRIRSLIILVAAVLVTAPVWAQDGPVAATTEPARAAAALPPPAKKDFVHPPLKCMEPYVNITEYPVIGWAFHGRGCPGYNAEYVKQAELAGFNGLIDVQLMLKPAEKFEQMMVLVPAFKFNAERLDNTIFKTYPGHPRLIGAILDDNCMGLIPVVRQSAKYIAEKYPHVVPFISENPAPQLQKDTPMRVLGTQNYEMWRGRGVIGYCERLNFDRAFGNQHNMSFWPLYAAPIGHTAYRFSVNAALAYGAQGVICFAYAPGDRWPEWKAPDGALAKIARPVHLYARKVAGKHIWGTRCLGVFHSELDAIPRGDGKAGVDKLVQSMDKNLLVGLLVPEKDFKEWKDQRAPDYAMVVDSRANRNWSESKPRDVKVSFHPLVCAEILPKELVDGPVKVRPIEPGVCVRLHLDTGDGLLLKLNPDLPPVLGDLAEPYAAVCTRMSALAFRSRLTRDRAEAARKKAEQPAAAAEGTADKPKAAEAKDKKVAKQKDKEAEANLFPDVPSLADGEFAKELKEIQTICQGLAEKAKTEQSKDTVGRLKGALDYLKELDPTAAPAKP